MDDHNPGRYDAVIGGLYATIRLEDVTHFRFDQHSTPRRSCNDATLSRQANMRRDRRLAKPSQPVEAVGWCVGSP